MKRLEVTTETTSLKNYRLYWISQNIIAFFPS
jgi:hypothetical protein